MGIDACLEAYGTVTDERLVDANEFMSIRGCDRWSIKRSSFFPHPQTSVESEPSLRIAMGHRLYTVVTPRGPWPQIHEVIVTARAALPQVEWFYKSDIDEGRGELVTDEMLSDLWSHWLSGPDPYHGYFD